MTTVPASQALPNEAVSEHLSYIITKPQLLLVTTSEIRRANMTKQSAVEKDHRKPCTLCQKPRDVLVRCQIDDTGKWHFVCPGTCWKTVSGGVVDGDKSEDHVHYRYGGMWKNKHDAVSAKMPKKVSRQSKKKANETQSEDIISSE